MKLKLSHCTTPILEYVEQFPFVSAEHDQYGPENEGENSKLLFINTDMKMILSAQFPYNLNSSASSDIQEEVCENYQKPIRISILSMAMV